MVRVQQRPTQVRRQEIQSQRPVEQKKPVKIAVVEKKPEVETQKPVNTTPTGNQMQQKVDADFKRFQIQSLTPNTALKAEVKPQRSVIRDASFDEINQKLSTAKTELDSAKQVVDENNKKLSQQLSKLDGKLTEQERKDYITQFHKENAEATQRLERATTALGDVVNEAAKLPNMPPVTAIRTMEAAKALADTPEGAAAAKDFSVAIAKQLEKNPNYFTGGGAGLTREQAERELNTIVSKAVPNLYARELRLANGDPTAAGDAFAKQVEGLDRMKTFSSSAEQIKKGTQALKNADFDALKVLDKNNAFGKSFQAAGVALGIAKLASGADIKATDYLQTVAATGKDGAELLAMGLKSIATSSKVSTATALGAEAAESFLSRVAPGLGVAANLLQGVVNAEKLFSKDGNTGDGVAVVGDAVATVGSVLSMTVVGAPLGLPLQIVGTLTSKAGSMISDGINHEKDVVDQAQRLAAIGMDPQVADQVARVDPGAYKVLSERYSTDDLRALLVRNPNAFTSEYAAREYLAISNRQVGYPWMGQRR